MTKYILLSIFFFQALKVQAYFESAPASGQREMNGIVSDQMPQFFKEWSLVTVRYRTDSKELRMTYANEIAVKEMRKLAPKYPDGAIFAKIGIMTEDDPGFISSKVPSGARRIQYMVKDSKKYASTDGWGYALFDSSGNVFSDEPVQKKTVACAACHRLVPNRDFVFSRSMFLGKSELAAHTNDEQNKYKFTDLPVKLLPGSVTKYLKKYNNVKSLEGDIQKNAFSGTLDEVVPLLLDKSDLTLSPTILLVDEKNYTLIVPEESKKKTTECFGVNKKTYRILLQSNDKLVRDAIACR